MKAALAVRPVAPDTNANLATIVAMANQAHDAGADLVLFRETALTGDLRLPGTVCYVLRAAPPATGC